MEQIRLEIIPAPRPSLRTRLLALEYDRDHPRGAVQHHAARRTRREPGAITTRDDPAPHTGRGGWAWYTGSAGWMYRAALETILGEPRIQLLDDGAAHRIQMILG